MKKIIISKHSGYCMGVKRAFSGAENSALKNDNICIYGEMVHNKIALQSLYDKNITIKYSLNDIINDKTIKNVIIRAHGIPPYEEKILRENGKNIFDFTCPKVKQVQLLAENYSSKGHDIILFGKKDHPEVIGIAGYSKSNNFIIKNISDAESLPFLKIKNPVLISQTTMNSATFGEICTYLLKKLPDIKIINTLCNAPIKIQENAVSLAKKSDAMIIVGDKMSANTATLFEKIKGITDAYFIERMDELDIKALKLYNTIGIAGGSSTPLWQIEKIKSFLEKNL
jgi:4-hydroxy-3-methylbut-2-en-1-yl diphosphate reductase